LLEDLAGAVEASAGSRSELLPDLGRVAAAGNQALTARVECSEQGLQDRWHLLLTGVPHSLEASQNRSWGVGNTAAIAGLGDEFLESSFKLGFVAFFGSGGAKVGTVSALTLLILAGARFGTTGPLTSLWTLSSWTSAALMEGLVTTGQVGDGQAGLGLHTLVHLLFDILVDGLFALSGRIA